MTRLLRNLLGAVTLAASGTYTFVYLYRWEWNRAIMSAAIFVAAEVALVGSLLVQRLKRVSDRLDALDGDARRAAGTGVRLARIREARSEERRVGKAGSSARSPG